jgi:hypothetical protein
LIQLALKPHAIHEMERNVQLVDRGESPPPQWQNEPNMTASGRYISYYSVIDDRFVSLDIDNLIEMEQSPVSQKSSDSGLHIQLHPLVLLTISDQITRHTARQQRGPIIGGLLGQQNGREITLEHAFECPVTCGLNNETILPAAWFEERLQQCEYFPSIYYKYELTVVQSRMYTKIQLSTWLDGGQLLQPPDQLPLSFLSTDRSSRTITNPPSSLPSIPLGSKVPVQMEQSFL